MQMSNCNNEPYPLRAKHSQNTYADAYIKYHGDHLQPIYLTFSLVRLAGIEPTTLGFGGQYSIH